MIDQIISLYKSGNSITHISKILGISRNQCYNLANKEGLQLDGRRYRCNDNFFGEYTPASCYWAGFIAADGCIYVNNGSSISAVGSKNIIDWIKNVLKSELLIGNPTIKGVGNAYYIQFHGKRQFDKIIRFIYDESADNTRLHRKYNLAMHKSTETVLKKELEKKVVNLYISGKSINHIIRNTEFGYFRIYRILSNANIEILRTNKKVLAEDIKNKIIELRKNGKRVKEIGKLTGVSNPKISEFLREYQNGI